MSRILTRKRGLWLPRQRYHGLSSIRGPHRSPYFMGNFKHETPLKAKVDSFNVTTNAVGHTIAINNVGFQPKLVFFWWSGTTSSGDLSITQATMHFGFGVATGPTARWCQGSCEVHAADPTDPTTKGYADACVSQMNPGLTSSQGKLDIQSFEATGFTVIVDEQFGVNLRVHYAAITHPDMSVKLGQFTAPGAPGAQTVSSIGLGAIPTFVLTHGVNFNVGQAELNAPIGANDLTTQWAFDMDSTPTGTSVTRRYLTNGDSYALASATNPPTIGNRFTITGMAADQFSLTWSENNAAITVGYVAIAGIRVKVSIANSSTNTFTVSGLDFTPRLVMLLMHNTTTSTSDTMQSEAIRSLGFATGPSERRVAYNHTLQNSSSASCFLCSREDSIGLEANLSSDPTAIRNRTDVQSFGSDNFVLVRDVDGSQNMSHATLAFGEM